MSTTQDASHIDRIVAAARATYERITPAEPPGVVRAGALVVDTRTQVQREHGGSLPGAVVVVCNEGFSSTLAVMSLRAVGVAHATDLVGGFQALLGTDRLAVLEELATASSRRLDEDVA